ncbi:MAG: hypothetical protein COC08_07370 [Maribacter sp.]|nr:MAG: hypothetical protein COC08_08290 [Maribacter sp.]PHQ60477.1 MAG: hypothetical protein COC08_07370 [Maribacter sp.]
MAIRLSQELSLTRNVNSILPLGKDEQIKQALRYNNPKTRKFLVRLIGHFKLNSYIGYFLPGFWGRYISLPNPVQKYRNRW